MTSFRRLFCLLALLLSLLASGCTDGNGGSNGGDENGGTEAPENGEEPPKPEVSAERGKKLLFKEYQCTLCHRIGEVGGSNGPNLSKVGKKYVEALGSEEKALKFFNDHIDDPETYPGLDKEKYRFVKMPVFESMTEAERESIAAYLLTLGRE